MEEAIYINPFNLLELTSPNQNYLPTYLLISKEAVYNFSQILRF